MAENRFDKSNDLWSTTTLSIHSILPGLKFSSRFSYNLNNSYYKNFNPRVDEPGKPNVNNNIHELVHAQWLGIQKIHSRTTIHLANTKWGVFSLPPQITGSPEGVKRHWSYFSLMRVRTFNTWAMPKRQALRTGSMDQTATYLCRAPILQLRRPLLHDGILEKRLRRALAQGK